MPDGATSYGIPKCTGTHGDVMAAVGLGTLLDNLDDDKPVRIVDTGLEFKVELPREFNDDDLKAIAGSPGYPFLKTSAKVTVPTGVTNFVDYQQEQAKATRLREAREAAKKLTKQGRGLSAEISELMAQNELRSDWRLLQVLNSLQGDETANKLHVTIAQRDLPTLSQEIKAGLDGLAAKSPSAIKWPANLVQLFTPTAAKGYSRLKPDSIGRNDKTKEQWADSFVEWLKYRGYFTIACPFFHGSKSEHIRLLCPVPRHVSVRALHRIAEELRRSRVYGGPPKMDSLAVLRLAQLLISHSEEYAQETHEIIPGLNMIGQTPADVISGVMITNYQSLGKARAVSAMATLGLPGWFPVRSRDDADAWLGILDEHQKIIRGLRDDHSDEIDLLIKYRRFLERRAETASWALMEFVESYGPFLIRAREQKRPVKAFTTTNFRRVIVETKPKLREVLDDPGFRAVATAVRKATVSAQAQKAMHTPHYREIRYDLLPELRRKRSLPGGTAFLEAVADFISQYNSENARRRELGWRTPRNVTTEEFTSFLHWVEELTPSTVGALLCAYASCRDPRAPEEQESNEQAEAEEGPILA